MFTRVDIYWLGCKADTIKDIRKQWKVLYIDFVDKVEPTIPYFYELVFPWGYYKNFILEQFNDFETIDHFQMCFLLNYDVLRAGHKD